MRTRLRWPRARLSGIVVALSSVLLGSALVRAGDGSDTPPVWTRTATPRFVVLSPAPPDAVQRIAGALEAFAEAFRRLVPGANVDSVSPTLVFAFDGWEAYEPYAPRYEGRPLPVAGSFAGTALANDLTLTLGDPHNAWSVAYHELTHMIVAQTHRSPPAWFNEGVAEFYSTFSLAEDGLTVELGHLSPEHLLLLRRERLVPLDELLDVTTSSPLYNENDKRSIFYAQSWALVHYLFSEGGERLQHLFDFLDRAQQGQRTPAAFRAAFGMAPATLEAELSRYIHQSQWPVKRVSLGRRAVRTSAAFRSEALSEADHLSALAGLQWRLGRPDEARALAERALAQDETCAAALVIVSAAHAERQMDVEAVPFLLQAASLRIVDPFSALLFGTTSIAVQARAGEATFPRRDAVRMASAGLKQATTSFPRYAEAWAAMAHAALLDGAQADQALSSARRARTLAPWRRHYLLLEAQALMQRDDLTGARRLMDDVLEHDAGTVLADKAVDVIERIDALESARTRP
jgi:hypothetical protein